MYEPTRASVHNVGRVLMFCSWLASCLENGWSIRVRNAMKPGSWWGISCFAVRTALVLSLLLSGCALGRPQPTSEAATDSWGRCERSRMVNFMLFCRQTTVEPYSIRLDDGLGSPRDIRTSAPEKRASPN